MAWHVGYKKAGLPPQSGPFSNQNNPQTTSLFINFYIFLFFHAYNMSDNNKSSTLKSYMDSAAGTVHHGIGAVTGSETQKAKGDMKQATARAEQAASHDASLRGPGFTTTTQGAAVRDDPARAEGKWNQTAGAAKQTAGGVVGSEVSFFFFLFSPQPPNKKSGMMILTIEI